MSHRSPEQAPSEQPPSEQPPSEQAPSEQPPSAPPAPEQALSEQPLVGGRYRILPPAAPDPTVARLSPDQERGIDVETGTPVLVYPVQSKWAVGKLLEQEKNETTARLAAPLHSPWLLPVLLSTPRVVFASPPPATRPDVPLSTPEAVECLLQLCDVLSRAHAAGIVGVGADVHDVRVHRENEAWRITVVLPHLPPRGRGSHADLPPYTLTPVRRDLWTAVSFFRHLLAGHAPQANDRFRDPDPPLPPFGDDAAHTVLSALLSDQETVPGIPDVASLAERMRPLARVPADWQSRVAAMPHVTSVSTPRDWDRLIELGEAERLTCEDTRLAYVTYPLAAAYHQRALVARARGDLDAAMRDLDKAVSVDTCARYYVTRGVVRAARGDHDGALSDYEVAVPAADATEPTDGVSEWAWEPPDPLERARARYARGVARYRKGDLPGACDDLQTTLQTTRFLAGPPPATRQWPPPRWPTAARVREVEALARRAFVAVLRAMFPTGPGAFRADPEKSRWRWALAWNLRALGRAAEARAEGDRVLAAFPDDTRERRLHAHVFGE